MNKLLTLCLTSILFVCFNLFSFASSHLDSHNKEKETKNKSSSKTYNQIILTKELTFKKYTLEDIYKYNKKSRKFQWDKIKEKLAYISEIQKEHNNFGLVVNYKNQNGLAPVVINNSKNKYQNIIDSLGTERQQSVPLYKKDEIKKPTIYGRDGSLVKIISKDTLPMTRIMGLSNFEGEWDVPKKYIKPIGDSVLFKHVIIVDVTNQNICTLEHYKDNEWKIRSMNPSTTGKSSPPYSRKTPVGMFVVQEKKSKMFYNKDGTNVLEGFAPWASRFTNGAYIHGVPTKNPKGQIREYSSTLGTIPLSHMCVRNPSSHSKFIYDLIKPLQTLVIVID